MRQTHGDVAAQDLGLVADVSGSHHVGGDRALGEPRPLSRRATADDQAELCQVSQEMNISPFHTDDVARLGSGDAGRIRKGKGLSNPAQSTQSDGAVGTDKGHPIPGKCVVRCADTHLVGNRVPGSRVGRAPPPDERVFIWRQIIKRRVGPNAERQQRQQQSNQSNRRDRPTKSLPHLAPSYRPNLATASYADQDGQPYYYT